VRELEKANNRLSKVNRALSLSVQHGAEKKNRNKIKQKASN
jgi:hypothetical protein